MELTFVEEGGVRFVEGRPDETYMSNVDDSNRVIEECVSKSERQRVFNDIDAIGLLNEMYIVSLLLPGYLV